MQKLARFPMPLSEQCRVAELAASRRPGILRIHPLPNEFVRQQLKMRLRFQVKFRIGLLLSKKAANAGHKSKNPCIHRYFFASRRKTRPITPEIRSQFSVSTASCVRPRLVIE